MSVEGVDVENKSESLSLNDWQRMKSLLNAVPSSQQTLDEYKNKFDSFFDNNSTFHEFSAKIQNSTIRIRQLEKQNERARNRVRNAQHRLTVAIEDNTKKVEAQCELNKEIDRVKSEIETLEAKNTTARNTYVLLCNEIVFRRRYLLDQLYKLYFFDDHLVRHFKRNCLCTNYECISGLHLPAISERADHLALQNGGAISHLVNLLNCISKVLDVPLRNPTVFYGSHSIIINRITMKRFDFFQTLTKAPKEHAELCLRLLCQNIVQLQTDCGCLEYKFDANDPQIVLSIYPISRLRETLKRCIGHYRFEVENDQSTNLFSCSSLIPRTITSNEVVKKDQFYLPTTRKSLLDVSSSSTGLTANAT
ncbi:hypothetical protein M3Y94_00795800 [Aphelenchoides besseyi]|nr:hypothetical protein M3Y94_00795800 [Aphelenchoides besseyi]KAI6232491.1 hypothetical protein M3Y95_00491500 [Aphelenchoides besseyi]